MKTIKRISGVLHVVGVVLLCFALIASIYAAANYGTVWSSMRGKLAESGVETNFLTKIKFDNRLYSALSAALADKDSATTARAAKLEKYFADFASDAEANRETVLTNEREELLSYFENEFDYAAFLERYNKLENGEGAQEQEKGARGQGDRGGVSARITEAQSRLFLKQHRTESTEHEAKKHMERCQTRRNTRMKVYTQSAQLIKYIVTGGLTTGVNYLIYFILLGAAGDAAQQSRVYLAANSAAWLGAVLFAYVMNRKLVFHSERAIVHEFLEFAGLRLATLAVENLLLYLLIDVWQWQSPLAKLAVSIITVAANYAACRLRIFRGGETKRIEEHI